MSSSTASELQIGALYQHYKGPLYRVHGLVHHSETMEEFVLYEALTKSDVGQMWVRPKTMFLENVEYQGRQVPRFRPLEENAG